MTDKDEFNAAANIIIPIENLEGSQNMTDIQNEEKMARMERELKILREELRQVRDLAKLSVTTFLTFKADLPSVDLPNQPEQTQHTLAHGRVPPASPTAVRTIPDLSNRDPTIPTMQQILGAHDATPYGPHVPPIYATGDPTFTMPAVVNVPYEVDQYEKMEKDTQLKEDALINAQLQGYKPPKFDMFDGKGDPHAHLRAYCDKLVGEMTEDFMTHFRFNTEITEYARRWRTEAARVQPPLDESELSKYFIRAQEAPTYQNPPKPYVPVQGLIHQNRLTYASRPRPNLETKNARSYTSITKPYAQLSERLRTTGVLQPVEGKLLDPIPSNFDRNKQCAYHSGIQSHYTKDCYRLNNQIESLIRRRVIKCTLGPPNVNNKPLTNLENREVNMVLLDEEYGDPNYPYIDEPDAMTSSAQPVITVQLREPLTIQISLSRVVMTTLIARKPEYNTKLDGATFHTFEIMQVVSVNEEAEPDDTKLSSVAKMVVSEMLKYGLGYELVLGKVHQGASDTIFIPEQALIPDQAGVDDIIEGLGNMFLAIAGEGEEINLS
ncbi:hypothetical protein H5410_016325 [Solanum commersonii]|uniref:Uncharacterized protein n=1 Tax=Solanum commersonii TaxID=4109 RepID=A0A9J5ZVY5_SOLCO|nr:hypothetical protein H5410_016325 [Solanum commersonii]